MINYLYARDYYFPDDVLDIRLNPLFRIAHEVWDAGSTYSVEQQEGVTWLQVCEGTGRWKIAGHNGEIRPGQLLCYGLEVPCCVELSQPLELRLIYTFPSGKTPAREYGIYPGHVRDLSEAAGPCITILDNILTCALSEVRNKQRIANALMRSWLEWVVSSSIESVSTSNLPLQAKHYIDTQLDNITSIEQVAQHTNCSIEHLSRLFSQQYGQSLWSYIRTRQMQLAAQMLRNKLLGIEQIASRLGYADRFSFSKAFKQYYGVPPGKVGRLV